MYAYTMNTEERENQRVDDIISDFCGRTGTITVQQLPKSYSLCPEHDVLWSYFYPSKVAAIFLRQDRYQGRDLGVAVGLFSYLKEDFKVLVIPIDDDYNSIIDRMLEAHHSSPCYHGDWTVPLELSDTQLLTSNTSLRSFRHQGKVITQAVRNGLVIASTETDDGLDWIQEGRCYTLLHNENSHRPIDGEY